MVGAGMGRQRGARGRGGTIGPTGDLPYAWINNGLHGPRAAHCIVHVMGISDKRRYGPHKHN